MNIRPIEIGDKPVLENSLEHDEYHKDTTGADFFYDPRSICNVYEDDLGPVFFMRATKSLRLDIQFLSNTDYKRNAKILLEGFDGLAQRARNAGFTELVFCSDSPSLIKFCKEKFGYQEVNGELRRLL